MSSDTFLTQFHNLTSAPNGIVKLRELVLQLAVRGLLVPQDSDDEPASVLMAKIKAEKERLITQGMIRKQKSLPSLEPGELPYELPAGWEWGRLGECCSTITDGSHNPPPKQPSGIPMLSSQNVLDGTISLDASRYISNSDYEKEQSRYSVEIGDVLLTIVGSIGRSAVVPPQFPVVALQRSIALLKTNHNPFYISLYIKSPEALRYYSIHGKGTAQKGIYLGQLSLLPVPLPPIAEQERVATAVDQLMTLVDDLEARQQERNGKRVILNKACLNSLTTPDGDTQQIAWQRIHDNFDLLYDVPETVPELRQAILQLAVQGKLVPQDPNDEPASVLLEKIENKRKELAKDGKIRKLKSLPPINPDEVPYVLPSGWEWVRLQSAFDVRDGTHDTPKYIDSGFPLVTSKNLSSGFLDLSNVKYISENDHKAISQRSYVQKSDILFAMIGSIGNPVIVDVDTEFSIKNVALFKYYSPSLSEPEYLLHFLALESERMRGKAGGGVQSFVSLTYLRNYLIPLPPLNEQHRIASRISKFMNYCDELENTLKKSQSSAEQLMASVVEQLTAA